MANRNIAFTISLNGTEQVFGSIAELENAIKTATQELKNFTGTEEDFKRLQEEIKKANNELNRVKEGTRGLSVEKQIGQFLKFGQVVTSAFGAATTALSLFGKENTDVTEAAAKAQQILTLQYSLVTLAKEKDTIKTVLNTAATIANTIATQGLTAATRLLFTLIRANPFGAFLTIVTAVASALILFKDNTEDATKAEEQFQATLKKGQLERQRNIELLRAQGKTELELAEQALKNADDRFRTAQFYYLNTSKDAENFAAREEEYETAKFERTIAQLNLDKVKADLLKEQQEDQKDREEEERKRQEELNRLRQEAIQLAIETYRAQNQLNFVGKQIGDNEARLVQTLESRLSTLKNLAQTEEGYLSIQEKLSNLTKENTTQSDAYGVVFENLREKVEMYFKELKDGTFDLEKSRKDLRGFVVELFESTQGALDPRQLDDFFFYTEEYIQFYDQNLKMLSKTSKETRKQILNEFEQAVIDLALLRGEISPDPFLQGGYQGDPNRARTQTELLKDLTTAEDRYREVIKKLGEEYTKALRAQDKFKNATDKELQPLVQEQIDSFIKLTNQIVKYESDVDNTTMTIQKLNEEIQKLQVSAKEGFLVQNVSQLVQENDVDLTNLEVSKERLLELEKEIATKRFDFERQYAEDVIALQLQLSEKIPGFAKLSYEAKLIILKEYLEKEIKETEDAEKKKQDSTQKSIDKFLNAIQTAQQGLQLLQQTLSDYYNLQFDLLEKRNKRVQDTIVGDSKRALELRLEQEKAYTKEREKLEKQQAKIQLRLTLLQTIANVAQAVAQSLKNPVLATIVAAAGAAQIAIISRQIGMVDTYQRGGKIRKGQGGMVVGPSHENGGVKFQNGGIELEGSEAVINRLSTLRYADILSSINVSGGGRPIVMNNFDDSRIVEAIARQRQTPIRAYVVESEITNSQTINKRLELLSQI